MDANKNILKLSQEVLTKEEFDEAIKLCNIFKKDKKQVILHLQNKIGTRPKRFILYLRVALGSLHKNARECMFYMGAYIDQLVKFTAQDLLKNKMFFYHPFRSNIDKIKTLLPEKLYLNLKMFDNIINKPAKHNFDPLEQERKHLFSSDEVILTCYMTVRLKNELIKLSDMAKDYTEEKIVI